MENLTFLKNGVLRLPPGFRFHPTDEELILQYLIKKALSSPLPAAVIPDADVCRFDPWDLPGSFRFHFVFFFSFGDLAMIFLMGFVKFLMGQGIWSGRGTFSVLDKPNTLMEEGRTEPPVLGIGRPLESTAGLFLPRRIGWWGWRKRSCSTLETLLMAWELIGLCTSIALSETPKLLLPPLMANYPPWWASPVWNWIEPKNPSGIEKLN